MSDASVNGGLSRGTNCARVCYGVCLRHNPLFIAFIGACLCGTDRLVNTLFILLGRFQLAQPLTMPHPLNILGPCPSGTRSGTAMFTRLRRPLFALVGPWCSAMKRISTRLDPTASQVLSKRHDLCWNHMLHLGTEPCVLLVTTGYSYMSYSSSSSDCSSRNCTISNLTLLNGSI